jgi:WD40 repeat protein
MDHTTPPHPKFRRDDQGNLWLNFGEYGEQIEIACFSADGARLLTVRDVGVAQVWDTLSGQLVGELRPDSPLAGSDRGPTTRPFEVFIEAASLSPDGTRALLGLNDGTAGLFDIASGDRLSTLHDPDQPPAAQWGVIRAVAYAPDGAGVAIGFPGRAVGVWDSNSATCLAFLRDPLAARPFLLNDGPRPALISTVAFSPDSRYLFAGAADGIITIWDLATQQVVFSAGAHTDRTIAVGTHGAAVRWATDGGSVWEAELGQAARPVLATQARWIEATFDPSGTALLARTHREVQRWNLETGAVEGWPVADSFGHGSRSRTLAYDPDGTYHVFPLSAHLLTLSGAGAAVELRRSSKIDRVSFSPDGKVVVTEGWSPQVELWSVPSGTCLASIPVPGNSGATAISWDGQLLAVGALGQGGDGPIRPISIWNIAEQRQLYQLLGHIHQVQSLAFRPDRRWLVSASLDRTVRLWSLGLDGAEPHETAQLAYDDLEFASLHVFSDGRILVFRRSCLEIWRELRELLLRIEAPHPFDCRWQIIGDEQQIAITFHMDQVGVWSLSDGAFLGWATADIPRPESLFSEAILQQVTPTAGAALWRGPGGPYLYIGDGPRGWATPLSLSPDRHETVVPCVQGAALIAIELEPRLIQLMPFSGRLRASCITAEQVVLVNADGLVFRSLRNSADTGGG